MKGLKIGNFFLLKSRISYLGKSTYLIARKIRGF